MCFSAQVWADYHTYVRKMGADIDITTFHELYAKKRDGAKIKTPKAMDLSFRSDEGERLSQLHDLVEGIHAADIQGYEQELFKQVKRLADAKRSLASKSTEKALDDERISTTKIEQLKARLAKLKSSEVRPSDSRIFPGMYAPVMVWEEGKRVIKPMRYQCRPAGKPAFYDR